MGRGRKESDRNVSFQCSPARPQSHSEGRLRRSQGVESRQLEGVARDPPTHGESMEQGATQAFTGKRPGEAKPSADPKGGWNAPLCPNGLSFAQAFC